MLINTKSNPFLQGRRIQPLHYKRGSGIEKIIDSYKSSCFEARKISEGALLYKQMVESNDTIWLGISGAGIVGGLGGYIIDLIETGFIDVICSTGAQIYHDLHFAFDFPIFQGSLNIDDNTLRKHRVIRIHDMFLPEETLLEQDKIIRDFGRKLKQKRRSSADLSYELGRYTLENSPHPEKSFVARATESGVPVFWDSESNHSIAMNIAALNIEGINIEPSPSLSLLESAAIVYDSKHTGFIELGGGGPKNWIQTLAPMINQILGLDYKGADRGIQITTAPIHDGGLSGCTFSEGVTWKKYQYAGRGLVQIHGEYSSIFPLITGYVLETCAPKKPKKLFYEKEVFTDKMLSDRKV